MFAIPRPTGSPPSRVLLERLRALELELHRVEQAIAETIVAAHRGVAYRDDGHGSLLAWCRAANRWSTAESRRRIRIARLLHEHPSVAEAFRDGKIAIGQTDVLARAAANPRCGHRLAEPMPIFLQFAPRLSHREFELLVHRWMQFVDPDGAHRDGHEVHDARHARLHTDDDGRILLDAEGGGVQGALIRAVFDQYVQREFEADWSQCVREHGDAACADRMSRTDRQRRFDALHRVFLDASSRPPDARPPEPLVNLFVDVHTLARHLGRDTAELVRDRRSNDDAPRSHDTGHQPDDDADDDDEHDDDVDGDEHDDDDEAALVALARARAAQLCRHPRDAPLTWPRPVPRPDDGDTPVPPPTSPPRRRPRPARTDTSADTSANDLPDLRWIRSETTDGDHVPTGDIVRAMITGQVRRVVVDSAGVILDVGRRRRLFTGALRDAVLLASTRCLWPGCERPSSTCQADHLIDWRHDGATQLTNGGPLCGRHNRTKNQGFTIQRDPQGCWRVLRPDGTEV